MAGSQINVLRMDAVINATVTMKNKRIRFFMKFSANQS